jgi:hypothetical protein
LDTRIWQLISRHFHLLIHFLFSSLQPLFSVYQITANMYSHHLLIVGWLPCVCISEDLQYLRRVPCLLYKIRPVYLSDDRISFLANSTSGPSGPYTFASGPMPACNLVRRPAKTVARGLTAQPFLTNSRYLHIVCMQIRPFSFFWERPFSFFWERPFSL